MITFHDAPMNLIFYLLVKNSYELSYEFSFPFDPLQFSRHWVSLWFTNGLFWSGQKFSC